MPTPHVNGGTRQHDAEADTRIRLATSQQLVALARRADGSLWSQHVDVVVTMADAAKPRALIHLPATLRRGKAFEVRALLGHAMENGLRPDGYGNVVPRNLVTRFGCRLDGVLVCAVDLYPAIAAYPYLAFWARADGSGTLRFEWLGDNGFAHVETRALVVV